MSRLQSKHIEREGIDKNVIPAWIGEVQTAGKPYSEVIVPPCTLATGNPCRYDGLVPVKSNGMNVLGRQIIFLDYV